jgi:TolB-like protein/Tfp pilus assembly protein PilF
MDFGAGFEYGEDSSDSARGLAGTPLYMAPEVLNGGSASVTSDVYSLGVVLYHLVTGSYPVRGSSVQEVRDAHAARTRTPLREAVARLKPGPTRVELPERFIRVVERATQHRPEDRYQTADALAEALATLAPRTRLVPVRYALGIAAALALVVAAAWQVFRPTEPAGANHVIAVMPFTNLSAASDDDLVWGLREEVIRNLTTISGVTVRSSVSPAGKTPGDARQRDQLLNADLVFEASVLPAGTRIRVNARLVRAADGVVRWAEMFERDRQDAFAMQGQISQSIVNALHLKLRSGQRRYDSNLEVYDLYLRARGLQARREPADRQAIDLLSEVVKRDREFAPAYAALASAYGNLSYTFPDRQATTMPPRQAYAIMRPLALEALRLDGNLPEAHAAMGWVESIEFDWAKAEASYERALALNPGLTTLYTDFVLTTLYPQGKLDEAMRQLEVARRGDPLSLDVRRVLATIQISAGRYDDALENCRRVLASDKEFPFVQMRCDQALMHRGDVDQAITMMENYLRGRPDAHTYGYLGCAWALAGRRDEAEAMAARNSALPHMQALIYGCLQDSGRAYSAIERLAAVNPVRALTWLTRPEMALLRGDPRVTALRRTFGLPS